MNPLKLKKTLSVLLTLAMLVQVIAVYSVTVSAADTDATPDVVYEESFNSGLWTVAPKVPGTNYDSYTPGAPTVTDGTMYLEEGDVAAFWWSKIPGVKETGSYTLTFDLVIASVGDNKSLISDTVWKRELLVGLGAYTNAAAFRSDGSNNVYAAGSGQGKVSDYAVGTYSVSIVWDNTANTVTTAISKGDTFSTEKTRDVDASAEGYDEYSLFWGFRCEDGAVELSNFTFTDGAISISGFETFGESFLTTEGEGLWTVEPKEFCGYDSYNPTAPFGYNGTLYLDEGEAAALYWKNIPGAKEKGIYTISFDLDITSTGNNNSLLAESVWKRELNVALGSSWNTASFRSDTEKILASGNGYTDSNYAASTYTVEIVWNNMMPINSVQTTIKSDTFSATKLTTLDSLSSEWYDEGSRFWSFRCEDGSAEISNFKVSVINEDDPASTTAVSIPSGQRLTYECDVTYNGEAVAVKLGSYELLSVSDSSLSVFNSTVNGSYGNGTYHVKATVSPTQKLILSEVTFPDGEYIKRGTKMPDDNRDFTLGRYGNVSGITGETFSYTDLSLDEFTVNTEEPVYEGFGANVYNIITSFTDARYDRAFAWTALESFIGDGTMAIKYRVSGESEWTVVDAVREEETLTDVENYFEADIANLQADTCYEYRIGKKDSTDEENDWSQSYYFTTAKESVKEFSFIAFGDNQGHSWAGATSSNKGYAYSQTAITQALSKLNNPAFIVNTGDLTENNYPAEWNWYFKALGETAMSIPHFATIGGGVHDNHDYFDMHFNHPNNGGKDAYTNPDEMLEATPTGAEIVNYLDETVYSFNYGDVHFIVLDSGAAGSANTKAIMIQQREWLAADLEANKDAKWKIVMTHQPAYKTGASNFDASFLADLVEGYGVDLVLQGHLHHVSRTYPIKDGEIVTKNFTDVIGKGAGTIYTTIGPATVNHAAYSSEYMEKMQTVVNNDNLMPCYTVIDVKEDGLTMTVRQADGLILDTFTITEEAYVPEEEPDVEIPGYGAVPGDYADATKYPFVVFANGEFVGAATSWSGIKTVAQEALVNGTTTVTALLRDDVSTDSPIYLYNINGTLEIDLGGYTVTGKSGILFNGKVYSTYEGDYASSVVVKNGTVVVDAKYIYYSENEQTAGTDKVMNLTFENVTIGKTSTSTQNQTFFAGYDKAAATKNNTLNLTLNGCTIDFADNTKSSTNLFHFTRMTLGSVHIAVNGGSIIYPTNKMALNMYGIDAGSTFTFGKYDGAYTTLSLADGAKVPTTQYTTTENGKLVFGKTGATTIDGVAYGEYRLGSEIDGYGFVPAEYSDATEYPFAAFVDGIFVGAASTWKEANTLARETLDANNGATVTVLLRDDATISAGCAGADYPVWMKGTVVFDLGGHTLTVSARMFSGNTSAAYTDSYESSVVVKNGTVLMNTYPFLSQNKQTQGEDKVINITFENVTLKKPSTSTQNQTFYASSNVSPTKNNTFNFTFNDCTFDFADNAKACYLFNFDRDKVIANIKINGGIIKAPASSTYKLTLSKLNSASSFAFGKGSDGKYPTLILPEGVSTVTDVLNTNSFVNVSGDKVAFVKDGDVYRLVCTELKITGAYLNLTNNINVFYAANVPEGYENPYMVFEFNGNSYTVTDFTEGEGGELLFAFKGVAPHMVGDNIKATLVATKGGVEESEEKAEYSVLTYCKNMLNKSDDEQLKTLLSDLLVYAAAAQTYVDYKADTLVTAGLELTPSEFVGLTETDKALSGDADGRASWLGVALRYENAMAMKFNFQASEELVLKVTVNGRTTVYGVEDWKTDEYGNYVVYFRGILATEYGDVVSAVFYDGEVQVGQCVTYSVNSYVYSMQDTEGTLAALVRATYNYGASAEIYAGK